MVPPLDTIGRSPSYLGYVLKEATDHPARLAAGVRFVNDGLGDGSLKPIIAQTFPLDEIVEAHRYLGPNQQIGKVVITVPCEPEIKSRPRRTAGGPKASNR